MSFEPINEPGSDGPAWAVWVALTVVAILFAASMAFGAT